MRILLPAAALLAFGGAAIAAQTTQSRDERSIEAIENEMASAQSADGVTRTWDDNISGEVVGNKAATARTGISSPLSPMSGQKSPG